VRGITSGVSDPAEEIKSETRDGKQKEGLKNQWIMGEMCTEAYSQRKHATKTKQWVFYLQLCLVLLTIYFHWIFLQEMYFLN